MLKNLLTISEKYKTSLPKTPKRNVHLYGISGLVFQPQHQIPSFVFSGYFKHDPSTKILHGELIDCFGASIIGGSMDKKQLSFRKEYYHRTSKIDYYFQNKKGIWIGEFRGPCVIAPGESKCLTNLMLEDASEVCINFLKHG